MKNVDDSTFDTDVLHAKGLVVVDFWAEWCGPCKALSPILDQVEADSGARFTFVKVNIDEAINTGTTYSVRSLPTLVLFNDGKEISRSVGSKPKSAILAWMAAASDNA